MTGAAGVAQFAMHVPNLRRLRIVVLQLPLSMRGHSRHPNGANWKPDFEKNALDPP